MRELVEVALFTDDVSATRVFARLSVGSLSYQRDPDARLLELSES